MQSGLLVPLEGVGASPRIQKMFAEGVRGRCSRQLILTLHVSFVYQTKQTYHKTAVVNDHDSVYEIGPPRLTTTPTGDS